MANDVLYLQLLAQIRDHNHHLSEFVTKVSHNSDQPAKDSLRRECHRLILTQGHLANIIHILPVICGVDGAG